MTEEKIESIEKIGQKEKRYVGVKETILYGVANGGQCIGYNMITSQRSFFLSCKCSWCSRKNSFTHVYYYGFLGRN